LTAACTAREQAQRIHDAASNATEDAQAAYNTDKAELNTNANNLKSNTETAVSDIKTKFTAKEDEVKQLIQDIITAFKANISSVVVSLNQLDTASDDITCDITIVDEDAVAAVGAALTEIKRVHRLCIRAALILCGGNSAVVVVDASVSAKRATGDQYTATIGGSSPSGTPQPEGGVIPVPGSNPPPHQGGSSASTLMFSFVTLLVGLLVLF